MKETTESFTQKKLQAGLEPWQEAIEKTKQTNIMREHALDDLLKEREKLAEVLKQIDETLRASGRLGPAMPGKAELVSVKDKILHVLAAGKKMTRPEIDRAIEEHWGTRPNNLYTSIDDLVKKMAVKVMGKGRQAVYSLGPGLSK